MTHKPASDVLWPGGARAAVSLTYDDAVASQRTHAGPRLHARGLRGTFFLTGTAPDLKTHRRDGQRMHESGHELASHTMHHPCDCSHAWVPRGHTTQDYDLGRMRTELLETHSLLAGLGVQGPYTFAYPCGETRVGKEPVSYVGLVSELFVAARGVEARIADPARDPLTLVPAFDGAKSGDELARLLDAAEASGGWLVLLFHGVGGDHLPVSLEAHDALLAELERRRGRLWTERFGTVAAHVAASQARNSRA
jgi:peptidoglycan/xylan/chitin deacetylase (PgdA/CDA1 family)